MDKQTNKDIKSIVTGIKYGFYASGVVIIIAIIIKIFQVITGNF